MNLLRILAAAIFCWTALGGADVTFTTIERGANSQIEKPRQAVARTTAEWAALWKAHDGARPLPSLDFKRFMVVGVFAGSRPTAGYELEIVSMVQQDGGLVVSYRERRPGPGVIVAQMLTAPFHIVRTEAFSGPVKFERTP